MFWGDIMDSVWIGGSGDRGLHERTPYWLNGVVPLAYLLKNADSELLSGVSKTHGTHFKDLQADAINITDQVHKYVDAIVSYADPHGWLGPVDNPKDGNPYWGRSNVMLSLAMFAEAEPSRFTNTTKTMLNYMMEQKRRMTDPAYAKLGGWAAARWMDMALGAEWLLENAPQGKEAELLAYIKLLHEQGSDWESWFETFTGAAGGHNVNNAQALKSAAVLFRATRNETLHKLSKSRMANLDANYGLPTGMFNGDEILPNPRTRSPSRGIELCGVVEAMYSYNVMFSIHGDVQFADRAERIAYNALPATWASPKGGDMWAHQYLQAVNEINALKGANPHSWQHDGADAEMYGLEPNYGCCTANFNQGWPKFANMVVYATQDKGGAISHYAPASAKLPDGSTIDIDTTYPFEDTVAITVTAKSGMPIYLRIPSWASKATLDGKPVGPAGSMYKVLVSVGLTKLSLALSPEIKVEQWGDTPGDKSGPFSVHRGPLMYSLPIAANYTVVAHHFGGPNDSNDYQLDPNTPWRFAIDVDPNNPAKTLKFVPAPTGYVTGAAPFNHTGWPVSIVATVRSLPTWGTEVNSAAVPPASPACNGDKKCGPPQKIFLVPHGGTELRIGEMPNSGM